MEQELQYILIQWPSRFLKERFDFNFANMYIHGMHCYTCIYYVAHHLVKREYERGGIGGMGEGKRKGEREREKGGGGGGGDGRGRGEMKREIGRGRGRENERERESERVSMKRCVCLCVLTV